MLTAITRLVNTTLQTNFDSAAVQLSSDDVLHLIDLGDSDGGPTGRHWVLDPIDGTRGFENGRQYAVCLGMLEDGQAQLGVLGCPNIPVGRPAVQADAEPQAGAGTQRAGMGALFAAARGCGAFAGPLDGDGTSGCLVSNCLLYA